MLMITHIDLVRVFQLRAFNLNVNKMNSSKWRYHFLLRLTNVFYVNAKSLNECVKIWIRVVDFDSYVPYIFVTCLLWLDQPWSCILIMDLTRDFPGKGRFFGIRPF